ncbi:MAG: serine hydrolase [Thermomicrobiales bacterium]|nr:serine hydrolase [Thermomicrobiales bacterium]
MSLRRIIIPIVIALLIASTGVATARPNPASSGSPRSAALVGDVGLTAAGAIAVDLTTGIELYAVNADVSLPPASTAKIVTALVAIAILAPDQQVTIQASDLLDPTVYSTAGLIEGDVVSVHDLLFGVLLPSGGDAALAVARAAGLVLDPASADPVARFVDEMNAFAAAHGMTQSRFSNPVGMDDPANNYASARDLVRATEALLSDQLLLAIVGTPSFTMTADGPNARSWDIYSSNQLVTEDDVFGIKTGTEDAAGQCLITGFWRGDNRIVTVVLGSSDRYADTMQMMGAIDANYHWAALGIGTASAGATDALASEGLTFKVRRTTLMTREQFEAITWELEGETDASTPWVGIVEFSTGGRVIARLPVYSVSGAAGSLHHRRAA